MKQKTWMLAPMALVLLLSVATCTSDQKTVSSPTPTKTPATATNPATTAPTKAPTTTAAPAAAASAPAAPAAPEAAAPAIAPAPTTVAPATATAVTALETPAAATAEAAGSAVAVTPSPALSPAQTAPEALAPVVSPAAHEPAANGAAPTAGPGAAAPPTIGSVTWAPEAGPTAPATVAPIAEVASSAPEASAEGAPAPPSTTAAPAGAASATTASSLNVSSPPLTLPTPASESPSTSRAAATPGGFDGAATIPTPEGIFAQSSAALAALQSYRYTTVFSFTGEGQAGPKSGSVEVHGAVAGPDRQEMTWKDLDTGDQFGVLRVGKQAWMLDRETWNSVPTDVADVMSQLVLAFAPSMTWSGLAEGMETTSTYVGTETVNGVPARHYTSTYRGWSQYWEGGIRDVSGDVWIAGAGYPLRYRFTAKGLDKDGNGGSMLWTMELSDVNAPLSIDVPQ